MYTRKLIELNKQWLKDNEVLLCKLYNDGESILSIQQISPTKKIGRKFIEQLLIKNNIEIRGFKQQATDNKKQKTKQTNLKNFGFENASSSPKIKLKREKTVKSLYGVLNVFQNQEIKKKIYETNINRYGHPNPACHHRHNVIISKPHRLVSNALLENLIDHENEKVIYNQEVFTKCKAPRADIVINNKLIIEIFGDYWHANPLKYTKTDLIAVFGGAIEAQEIWKRDIIRINKLIKCGYKVLIIWEYEIKTNLNLVINRIKNELENC